MEAYFVNPFAPGRKASGHRRLKKSGKRSKHMAKKRKTKKRRSAAQRAATEKMPAANKAGRRARKAESRRGKEAKKGSGKSSKRRTTKRRRHEVHAHEVRSYRRPAHGAYYMSNPKLDVKGLGKVAMGGLVAAGVLFGALFAVGWVNGQKNRVPMLASGWGALAAKFAIGLAAVYAAHTAAKKGWLSASNAGVLGAAGFAPLGLDLLGRIAPGIASHVSLADEAGMGDITSRGLIAADLQANLAANLQADLQAEPEEEAEVSSY
ncbi:MAG: hypothetical protein KGI98_15965 [Euryarchaeota archaeon]|nr:hypothetical protein [Euryarchaeota archaeon]